MNTLAHVCDSMDAHARFVSAQVQKARKDQAYRARLEKDWKAIRDGVGTVHTPTGLPLPAIALPMTDEPSEIARYLHAEGLPGQFPYVNGIYREPYPQATGAGSMVEEPTRLFAGLGLAELCHIDQECASGVCSTNTGACVNSQPFPSPAICTAFTKAPDAGDTAWVLTANPLSIRSRPRSRKLATWDGTWCVGGLRPASCPRR